MIKAPIYNLEGKNKGEVDLPEDVFNLPWNDDLVHQIIVSYDANERANIAHTKNRGEVAGANKKPHKQKGRGKARHGSRQSPIWRGGGVTFGPRNDKSYSKIINKKSKNKALLVALSQKVRDNGLAFSEDLVFTKPKTSIAKNFVDVIKKDLSKGRGSVLVVLPNDNDINIRKSFSNIPKVETTTTKALNAKLALKAQTVVLVNKDESIDEIKSRKV